MTRQEYNDYVRDIKIFLPKGLKRIIRKITRKPISVENEMMPRDECFSISAKNLAQPTIQRQNPN